MDRVRPRHAHSHTLTHTGRHIHIQAPKPISVHRPMTDKELDQFNKHITRYNNTTQQ